MQASYERWTSELPLISSRWTGDYFCFALIFLYLIIGWFVFLMDSKPLTTHSLPVFANILGLDVVLWLLSATLMISFFTHCYPLLH